MAEDSAADRVAVASAEVRAAVDSAEDRAAAASAADREVADFSAAPVDGDTDRPRAADSDGLITDADADVSAALCRLSEPCSRLLPRLRCL